MRIVELRAENIKNLKAIEIKPGNDAVVLVGANGAGKSAVLDALFMGLTGKKIEQPIRNGEKRAEINVDLGEYKIKRVYTEKADRLEVVSKEGMPMKSPQALLNTLFGDIGFDPLKFANMGEKPQRELLAQLVGLDFTEIDTARLALYNLRTIRNREIKGGDTGQYRKDPLAPLPLESLVGQMEIPEPGTPRQEISMADELTKVSELETKRDGYLNALSAKKTVEDEIKKTADLTIQLEKEYSEKISDRQNEMTRIQKEVEGLQKAMKDNAAGGRSAIDSLSEKLKAVVIPEEVTQLSIMLARQALSDIEAMNIKIRKATEYDKKQGELFNAKKVIATLESDMMKIDLEKDQKIKAANFPIEGLAITDACVIYNGKPFSQLSTGEQIRVSTAIAMALNPTLKFIIIREGSLLDEQGQEEVIEMAKGRDYQIIIEKVAGRDKDGNPPKAGIYIEAGDIVSINGEIKA